MRSRAGTTLIRADGLTKYYGSFVGLQRVSFAIPCGQIVAVIGPNGAGKTTLLRLLTGYLPPSAGTAAICGFDIERDRLAAVARLGYLPENGPLYSDLAPIDLLRFSGEVRRMPPGDLDARIRSVADSCGIGQILDKPIGELSKGLRQRVGVAHALLHDPPVLIMDEPTSGLDPAQIAEFHHQMRSLGRIKTILISTHSLSEVPAISDRVLFIDRGLLVFDGSPEQFGAGGSLEASFMRLTSGTAPDSLPQPFVETVGDRR